MSKHSWTCEQLAAITRNSGDILVSAGAGSGKTSVLTERIIRRLCDPENPADITRMLIVTFTNAATEELRSRVSEALRARLAAEPGNRRLRRQLLLLPSARIDTISSFCLSIVRPNLNSLGLPAGLRVCDENESDLLAAEVMDSVIDGFYEGLYSAGAGIDFGEFCDAFVSDRDDKLAGLFLDLYRKLREYAAGARLLAENARALSSASAGDTDFMSTPWGGSIACELQVRLGYYTAVLKQAADMFSYDEKLLAAYCEQFTHDFNFAQRLKQMLSDGANYESLREYIGSYKAIRLGSLRNYEKTAELEFYRSVRSSFASSTGFIKEIYKKYFLTDVSLLRRVLSDCALQCKGFYALISVFDEKFSLEKRRRGIADYSDLERFAYRLLYSEDGSLSEHARAVAAEFDELYIDEYQDTNELEDMIFSALAKSPAETGEPAGRARFMVGDVKQSIYGFRGAEPSLFAAYRSDKSVETMYLRSNFRSGRAIIGFANRISKYIFGGSGSEVDYGEGDKLVFGKQADSPDHKVRAVLFAKESDGETASPDDPDSGFVPSDEIGEPIEPEDIEAEDIGEPEFVADEIFRLLESGEYKPEDIAILLRSTKDRSQIYEKALHMRGIGASGGGSDFFARPEVLAMVCLINSVGNPSRDIYIAGALRSPFFGFSFDDLIRIRRLLPADSGELPFYLGDSDPGKPVQEKTAGGALSKRTAGDVIYDGCPVNTAENQAETGCSAKDSAGGICASQPVNSKSLSLYEALLLYTQTTGFEKGRFFLDKLELYRLYAQSNPADRVLRFIYSDIGAAVFTAGGGDASDLTARKRSLLQLYELARTFEHGSFKGLGSFIEYLDGLIESSVPLSAAQESGKSGVRIMSIHKSKGLEFPVCFLCDCARRFNETDMKKPVLFDRRLGAAAKLGDSSGFGIIDTPVRTATALSMTRRMKYEEMRALYVAVTRPREKLYITATLSDPAALLENADTVSKYLPHDAMGADVIGANNFISWIAAALGGKSDEWTDFEIYGESRSTSLPEDGAADSYTGLSDESGGSGIEGFQHDIGTRSGAQACNPLKVAEFTEIFERRLNFSYRWKPLEKLPAKLSVSKLYPSILDEDGNEGDFNLTDQDAFIFAGNELILPESGSYDESKPAGRKFLPPRFLSPEIEAGAAERGTATHIFMQFCDFGNTKKHGVRTELERLVSGRFMTEAHAALVDISAVEKFFGSTLYAEMQSSKRLYREVRFNVRLPASEFTRSEDLRLLLAGEPVLVQGVIDCYYETESGGLRLVDYKTDRITESLRADARKADELLISRHSRQLRYYSLAVEKLTGKAVERCAIYSFSLGRPIYLK